MNKFDYKNLTPFKWFVLENFPFIEADFDALTEWQLFCKLGKEINKIIDSQNIVGTQMENVTNAFIELQNFVNNYFENLDVQDEINNKLNEMTENGTLTLLIKKYVDPIYKEYEETINTQITNQNAKIENINSKVNSVSSGSPAGIYSTITELENDNPDHSKIYVVSDDGKWYYWNGSTWTAGGVYQSTKIADDSITNQMLKNTSFATDYDDWSKLTNASGGGPSSWTVDKVYEPGYVKNIHININSETEQTGKIRIFKKLNDTEYQLYKDIPVTGKGDVYVDINELFDFEFIIGTYNLPSISYLNGKFLGDFKYHTAIDYETISNNIYTFNFNYEYAFAIGVTYNGVKNVCYEAFNMIENFKLPTAKIAKGNSEYPLTFDFENNKVIIDMYLLDRTKSESSRISQELEITETTGGFFYVVLYDTTSNTFSLSYLNSNTGHDFNIDLSNKLLVGYVYRYSDIFDIRIGSINSNYIQVIDKHSLNTDITEEDDRIIPKFGEKEIVNISTMHNQWFNKTVNCLGDSICKAENSADSYKRMKNDNIASILKEKFAFQTSRNYGVGGSRITSHSDSHFPQKGMVDRYINMQKADLIIIEGGTNDFGNNVQMGSLSDLTDNTKFIPAFYNLLNGLQTNFPDAKLLVLTPIHRNDNKPDNIKNEVGLTLKDYRNAEIEICELLSVPYLDMWTDLGFTPFNTVQKTTYIPDGLHPNILGMRIYGNVIIGKVENMYPKK